MTQEFDFVMIIANSFAYFFHGKYKWGRYFGEKQLNELADILKDDCDFELQDPSEEVKVEAGAFRANVDKEISADEIDRALSFLDADFIDGVVWMMEDKFSISLHEITERFRRSFSIAEIKEALHDSVHESRIVLPIKRGWFQMILSGEKKEEYREMKPYYESRFRFQDECVVEFRNGYSNSSPSFDAEVSISSGNGKPEWGAEPGKEYYVLTINDLRIDLSDKKITEVPVEVCAYYGLNTLDLSHNRDLYALPREIGNLSALKKLVLRGTGITGLPDSIIMLENLELLDMNHISYFAETGDFFSLERDSAMVLAKLPMLKFLDIAGCDCGFLSGLPDEEMFAHLETLVLSDGEDMWKMPPPILRRWSDRILNVRFALNGMPIDDQFNLTQMIKDGKWDSISRNTDAFTACSYKITKGINKYGNVRK